VWFYVRGEEYSGQIDHFVRAVGDRSGETSSSFRSAAETDEALAMILTDAARGPALAKGVPARDAPPARGLALFGRRRSRAEGERG
jgi:hypothetical protein